MLFDTLRTVRLTCLSGHIMVLEPKSDVHVPLPLHSSAIAAGCIPRVDTPEKIEKVIEEIKEAAKPVFVAAEMDYNQKQAALIEICQELAARGDEKDFTSLGRPNRHVVNKLASFSYTNAELDRAFQTLMKVGDKK